MKKVALAAAVSMAASAAFAGTPMVEEPTMVEMVEEGSSASIGSAGWAILALLLIGAAVAASND